MLELFSMLAAMLGPPPYSIFILLIFSLRPRQKVWNKGTERFLSITIRDRIYSRIRVIVVSL